MIRVFKIGPHAIRTPLSYPALEPLFDGRIKIVKRPEDADLYIFAHVLDVQNPPPALVEDWRATAATHHTSLGRTFLGHHLGRPAPRAPPHD